MASSRFATAVNCMDGRTQYPVAEYLRAEYKVDYVDTVTEAGPDRILAGQEPLSEAIRKRVAISVEKHGSEVIAVVGHYDCAGNPVDKDTHLGQIRESVHTVSQWFPDAEVIGLWVGRDWRVNRI